MTENKHAQNGSESNGHMPQLDGVRAMAVLAVLFAHWTPLTYYGDFGVMGVQCFFVLSGFLITGILLRGKDLAETGRFGRGHVLRQFYARRFLRIFPAYYLTLWVAAYFAVGSARTAFWWHSAYLSNVYMALVPEESYVNHFWSLAVEEQFYLLWPCAIVFAPRRYLPHAMAIVFLSSPAYRWAAQLAHLNGYAKDCQLFSNTDSLSLGALLALSWHYGGALEWVRTAIARIGLWIGIPLLVMTVIAHGTPALRYTFPVSYSHVLFAFGFAWFVDGAARGFSGPGGRLLLLPPMRYLGRISYGVYLFHGPLGEGVPRFFRAFGLPYPSHFAAQFALLFVVVLVLATASWYAMEGPINALKRHFPYKPTESSGG